ncbi:MAG: hypothetical protein AUK54_05915 [Helicobacteraceae bacterium CG2_30_36_10]|nr:MAG: hypothetical protein AUK54_05915 [Helicobacteraceae bacterium CG2_30_36_10]
MENNRTPTKPVLEISLALSGGAARGTFHLGFVEALQENGVQIKAISGTSAGALAGGALACGITPKEIMSILKSSEFRNIFKFNWFRKSLFSIDYKADVIFKLFPLGNLKDTKIPFYACVTDINNHEVIYANKGDGRTLILASCALIPVFEPIMDENRLLADGGILDLLPTTPLLQYNYPILGINLMPYKTPGEYNFFTLIARVLQLLFTARLSQNINNCQWYIAPQELSNVKMFSLNSLQKGFDLGYAKGLKWCEAQL